MRRFVTQIAGRLVRRGDMPLGNAGLRIDFLHLPIGVFASKISVALDPLRQMIIYAKNVRGHALVLDRALRLQRLHEAAQGGEVLELLGIRGNSQISIDQRNDR